MRPGAVREAARAQCAAALLHIDTDLVIDALAAAVRAVGSATRAHTALMGLSGGLDSAVLATVAVRALGPDRVRLVYLYDRTSSSAGRANARAVAAWLNVPLDEVSIEAGMRGAGVYSSGAARLTSWSDLLNRLLYRVYAVATGETPFVSCLRAGEHGAPDDEHAGGLHRRLALQAEAGFAARHRRRRALLQAQAEAGDCFLLGAANKTEWLTGWFVKGGIDDLTDQPLKGLYKTQVRQLAAALGVPAGVLGAPPSPDMMRGISDELALGMPYPVIDVALAVLEGDVAIDQAERAGMAAAELDRVRQLTKLSAWKRETPFADG